MANGVAWSAAGTAKLRFALVPHAARGGGCERYEARVAMAAGVRAQGVAMDDGSVGGTCGGGDGMAWRRGGESDTAVVVGADLWGVACSHPGDERDVRAITA